MKTSTAEILSPRVQRLHKDLQSLGESALREFWEKIIKNDAISNVGELVLYTGVFHAQLAIGYGLSPARPTQEAGYFRIQKGNRMTTKKTSPQSIDEYITGFPDDVQKILEKIRMTIRKAAPDAEETINYGIPTFTLNGNLVHFAAFKKHIGFYPTPTGVEKFKEELSAYEGAKGSVQLPFDQPMPYGLISKIVKFRVKENSERAASKGKQKRGP